METNLKPYTNKFSIITFYKQLQLKYNNLNLGKCCSQLKIPNWNSNVNKSQLNGIHF